VPASSLHQRFDEVEDVSTEEEVSSSREELQVGRNTSCHNSLLFCLKLEMLTCSLNCY